MLVHTALQRQRVQ